MKIRRFFEAEEQKDIATERVEEILKELKQQIISIDTTKL